MKITKEWLAQQEDLYLTEMIALLIREKARREQIITRNKAKGARVYT